MQILPPLNNKKRNKEKETLSLSSCPEPIRRYFAELRPERKRETEWSEFETLRKDFSDTDISTCFDYLAQKGTPPSGEPCHSPMAYLSKAINQVLTEAQALRMQEIQKAEHCAAQETRVRKELEKREHEDREWEHMSAAFDAAFSNESHKQQVISEFLLKSGLGFRPGSEAARSLAISAWWAEHHAINEPNGEITNETKNR